MPDIEKLKQEALKKFSSTSNRAVDFDAARNISLRDRSYVDLGDSDSYEDYVNKALAKEEVKKKEVLKQIGVTDKDLDDAVSKNEWLNKFKTAANVIGGTVANIATLGYVNDDENFLFDKKSKEQVINETIKNRLDQKAYDRAKNSDVVKRLVDGKVSYIPMSFVKDHYLQDDDMWDKLKYSLGIETDSFGNKKLVAKGFDNFYLDTDDKGNPVFTLADKKSSKILKERGNTLLNAYGSQSTNAGFWRDALAGVSTLGGDVYKDLNSFYNSLQNLDPLKDQKLKDKENREYEDMMSSINREQSTPSQSKAFSLGWLGAGIGQGVSSIAEMSLYAAATGGIGRFGAAGLRGVGGLIEGAGSKALAKNMATNVAIKDLGAAIVKSGVYGQTAQNLSTFVAGTILNGSEFKQSAIDAGLDPKSASAVALLGGAVNGLIESFVGTNRLFNYLSGGGDKVLARKMVNELGEKVTEKSLSRVLGGLKKGLTGNASAFLDNLFEKRIIGTALEEGTEEFLQTLSQKGIENLYDIAFASDKKVGQGKYGSELFSMDTLKEALESAFFGAVVGGIMDTKGAVTDKIKELRYGKQTSQDQYIIEAIANGETDNVKNTINKLHGGKLISDMQKELFLDRVNQLDNLFKNNGGFAALNEYDDKDRADLIKKSALNTVSQLFSLQQRTEKIKKDIEDLNKDPELSSNTDKQAKLKELNKKLKNNELNIKFFKDYVDEHYMPDNLNKVKAYEENYNNPDEILTNKFNRFLIKNDITDIDRQIETANNTINQHEELLNNNTSDLTPKEVRSVIDSNKGIVTILENIKKSKQKALDDWHNEYNIITSQEYQDNLNKETEEEVEQRNPVSTTTPVESTPEIHNPNNSFVQQDEEGSPLTHEELLNSKIQEIKDQLEDPNLEADTINQLHDQLDAYEEELYNFQNNKNTVQNDYDTFVQQHSQLVSAILNDNLDPNRLNDALSTVKKDLEQTMSGFKSNGIDTSALEQLHSDISNKILEARQKIKEVADEANRLAEESKKATERDNTPIVSTTSFFDRIERLSFMNSNPDYYSNEEFNQLMLGTSIDEINKGLSITLIPIETTFDKNGNPRVAGDKIGTWNNNTDIVNPKFIFRLNYNGKGLGNFNQIDGFTVLNSNADINISPEQYEETKVRNIKLLALLQNGDLSPQDLQDLGFILNWRGVNFESNDNIPRKLLKDFKPAKLVGKSGKPFYYIVDTNNAADLEITNLVDDISTEFDNVPNRSTDLTDRYQVLVQANNGKLYWIGSQNQTLSIDQQNGIYKSLLKSVEKLKTLTDENEIKEEVSRVNRFLADNYFIANKSKTNTQLQLYTPNKTNKGYKIGLKGLKSRVELDPSKYGTMSDILKDLGLDNTSIRKSLVNKANINQAIESLSANATENIFKGLRLSIKMDNNKLDNLLASRASSSSTTSTVSTTPSNLTREEALKQAEEEWANNVDENGYPKEALPPILDGINDYYDNIDGNQSIQESDNPFANYDSEGTDPTVSIDNDETIVNIERRRQEELKNRFGNHVELISSKNNTVIQRNGLFLPNKENYSPQRVPTEKLFKEFDEINAKYDAELAEVEKQSKPKNNKAESTLLDLTKFDKGYDKLSEEDKAKASKEVAPLLEGYDGLSLIKKRGIDTKIRAIIDNYKPASNDPVFSIGTSEEVMDYDKAVEWINKNLPDFIKIDDVNKLLGSIKNNGITFGAFADSIIYLSNTSNKGTQYHESFHAVYRMLLSDKQIVALNNLAKSKYGVPTKEDIDKVRNSSSKYAGYSDSILSDIWLEEKMANEFQQYMLNNDQSTSGVKSIWNKIKQWFRFITNNMDELESLFYNINRGKFKNTKAQNNRFNKLSNNPVFQIYKKGEDEYGQDINTTQKEGQQIFSTMLTDFLQGIKDNKIDKRDSKAKNDLLDKLISDKAKFYSIDDNPYYTTWLEQNGLDNDEEFVNNMGDELELNKNVYTNKDNIANLKKDVLRASRIFDLDEVKEIEDRQDEIDDIGERFDVSVWTIGGETSFSKAIKQFISLATVNTVDKYGQTIKKAVDFKNVYSGLTRALAGIDENEILPRMKSLSEFSEDINAIYNKLLTEIGLTNEGNQDIQDIKEGYDLWRKFVQAFNNERVSWFTILHSMDQSRLIASNTNSAKDIQFNDWFQNYNLVFEESQFNEDLKKSINKTADALNRTENIEVSTFEEAKTRAKDIKKLFANLQIQLSEGYLAYSLLKKSDYSKLDDKAKEFLSAFSETPGLYDNNTIGFIAEQFKSKYNPFLTTFDEKKKEWGAITRLKEVAQQNALFDPTVGENSFQNADGKNVYSIIRGSFGLTQLRRLVNLKTRQSILDKEKLEDNFISPLENKQLNHLLSNENIDLVLKNLEPSMIDGIRNTPIEGDAIQINSQDGKTFGNFNASDYLMTELLMFLSNRKSLNTIDENGKTVKLGESALYNINQMEASSTGYGVFLPTVDYSGKEALSKASEVLYNYLAQEVIRIHKVKSTFDKDGNPINGVKRWVGYNDKLGARGFKLTEFTGYNLDQFVDDITSKESNKTAEDVYADLNYEKEKILKLIKDKLAQDIAAYTETLDNNNIINQLPTVELKKRGYLKDEKGAILNKEALIKDYYLNAYLNTLGINNLLLGNYSRKVKNTTDWFKRAKGIIGSGIDFGEGVTKIAVYQDPVKFIDTKTLSTIDKAQLIEVKRNQLTEDGLSEDEIKSEINKFSKELDKGKIDIADAQSYVTLDHKIMQLQRSGRFPKVVADIYEKLKRGEQITFPEKVILEDNNAALNSTKTVAYNGEHYFKLSELVLTPNLVNLPGFEYFKNKYESMLAQGVDQALPASASKMATLVPAKFAEDGKFDFTNSIMDIENRFKRLQVETPSGKTKITQGTQLIQLITSEQDDSLPVDFKYNSDIKTLGDLRLHYRQLLADNRYESFSTAMKYIQDPLTGEFDSTEIANKFYNTILESGSDEVLSSFFDPNNNFNWNLGPIINKAEQLFLAHFSKGVLSQKIPGLKVSLVSDAGVKIKDSKTGEMRSLRHMVEDEDGNYYSECLLPPFANELLGKDPSDDKIKDVLKLFGVRIPTDDKHSMMSLKVVGFLPIEYGSVGIFPKEIVYLSGADFDIDSEFIHRPDYYTTKEGKLIPYGTATTNEGKFAEYIKWNKSNNKLLKHRLHEIQQEELTDEEAVQLFLEGKNFELNKALKSLGMPSTLEEFIEQNPINIGANNNAMLEAQIKLLTNDYVRNQSATTPVSTESIENIESEISSIIKGDAGLIVSPNTPIARFEANRSNMEGKDGIGPVALANVTQSILTSANIKFFEGLNLPVITGTQSEGFTSNFVNSNPNLRKTDMMSALLNAMTDNAKLQLANKLGLKFNPKDNNVIKSLSVAAYMLAVGYSMDETMLFINLPKTRGEILVDFKLLNSFYKLEEKYHNEASSILGFDTRNVKALSPEQKKKYKDYKNKHTKPLSIETMKESLVIDDTTPANDYLHIMNAYNTFNALKQQSNYVSNVSTLLSLNKGFKPTFSDNSKKIEAISELQLDFINDFTKDKNVNTYKQLIDKLIESKYLRYNGNKLVADENLPTFFIGNVDDTPFDARLAILNDPNTTQNIIMFNKVMDASKNFFLLNTEPFIKASNITGLESKELIPFFMNKAIKTYLEAELPEKYQDFLKAESLSGYTIDKFNNNLLEDLKRLKKDPDTRNNILIKMLSLKSPNKSSKISQIEFPTRIKAEGDFYTNLNNGFKQLFLNPKTKDFANKLYYYSYFKDGLQFKNKSFINTMPSWVFKNVSKSLDLLNNDFKDNDYSKYTSLKESLIDTYLDLFNTLGNIQNLTDKLQNIYNGSFEKGTIETRANAQTNTTNTKFSEKILNKLDLTNKNNFKKSIEDNNLEEELLTGIKYQFIGNIKSTNNNDDGSKTEVKKGRILESVIAITDKGLVKYTVNDLLKLKLDNRELPTAVEVNYTNTEPIEDNSLTTTVSDSKFIEQYRENIKNINTKQKTTLPSQEEFEDVPILDSAVGDETEGFEESKNLDNKPFYEGNINTLKSNEVFVFGANDRGLHGRGAAGSAMGVQRSESQVSQLPDGFKGKWAVKGKTGPMQGTEGLSYGLVTVEGRLGGKTAANRMSDTKIINNIQGLYEAANRNPNKTFLIGYNNVESRSLNGFTGIEMMNLFNQAGTIPNNLKFSREWFESGILSLDNSENNSIFVNPFEGFDLSNKPDMSDIVDMANESQNDFQDAVTMNDFYNDLDDKAEDFRDANDDDLC